MHQYIKAQNRRYCNSLFIFVCICEQTPCFIDNREQKCYISSDKSEITETEKMKNIWLVVPCYNEEEVLRDSAEKLLNKYNTMMAEGKISADSRIVFIDDGSKDRTWEIISELHTENPIFQGIKLSRNRGHQNALLCGLMTLKDKADAVISIDADLQDDINAVDEMVDDYHKGYDVVYGVRSKRDTDTFFKRFTAEGFYKVMKALGVDIVFNHADYRLMSRRALEGLAEFSEVNLFLRGIVPMIGYPSDVVYYDRKERAAGESKYPLKKMLSFAFEGITSFSVRPLKIATTLGIFSLLVCLAMLIYCIVSKATGHAVAGWASIGASVWALGGLQLFMLGIIGEYVGKIYTETKHRPKYIIESIIIDREKLEK